ncbi:DUF4870 domain-containing protein [Roseimaritima sediminicola]|uniref:DUF4870 domain-containing protein n=1 Tax=Roseimaritima sediminicola TaxID=2662066 RepID=UPI0012984776|nr:DUF4870 domain-containing protein [Roseimaritima sediminicola]
MSNIPNEPPPPGAGLPPEDAFLSSSGAPTADEKNLSMLAHLSGLLGIVIGGVLGFLGPLILWIWKKDESPYIEREAREALNFQLTLLIIYCVTVAIGMVTCFGMVFIFVPVILQLVFGITATITASKGIPYRYPFNIRLIT